MQAAAAPGEQNVSAEQRAVSMLQAAVSKTYRGIKLRSCYLPPKACNHCNGCKVAGREVQAPAKAAGEARAGERVLGRGCCDARAEIGGHDEDVGRMHGHVQQLSTFRKKCELEQVKVDCQAESCFCC